MAAQGTFGTDFYDRSTRTIVGTMLWTEYRPVIKIGPKGALGSHEFRPIPFAPSLRQSITCNYFFQVRNWIIPQEFDHAEAEARHLIYESDTDSDQKLTRDEIFSKYDLFVGSQATDFGEALTRHDEF